MSPEACCTSVFPARQHGNAAEERQADPLSPRVLNSEPVCLRTSV
jgi:hypothetical protein